MGATGFLMLAACSFDTSSSSVETAALGDTDSESGETSATETASDGTSTTGSGSSPTTDPSAPTTDPSDPTTDPSDPTIDPSDPTTDPSDPTTETDTFDPTTDSDTETSGDGTGTIEIDGNDFGNVAYQSVPTREFTLTNVGDGPAENLGLVPSDPFSVDAGDCPKSLAAGDSCTATLSYDASTLGPFSGELLIGYDNTDGFQEITNALSVEVVGSTQNLIPDPSFENCTEGTQPTTWQNFTGPDWTCENWTGLSPQDGSLYLSGPDSNLDDFDVGTFVDLTPYEHAISTGSMRFEFRGQATSWSQNDDLYRLRIRYRNDGGVVETQYNPNFATTSSWTLYADDRAVPEGVVEARIDFYCQKSGGSFCDAYLDSLSLVGTYNP